MPTFQVVIPTFNAPEPRLRAAIQSAVLAPSCTGVIVVDDGSAQPVTESTIAIDRPDFIRLIRQPNAGPSAARNRGLDLITADFAFLLDDDDELLPDGVESLLNLAVKLDAVAGVASRIHLKPDGERVTKHAPSEWASRALPTPDDVFRPIVLFNGTGILVHRRALQAGARFDPSLMLGEDRDFLRRVADHGPIAVSAEPAILQRLHPSDATNLTSMSRLARRVEDHLKLLRRYHTTQGDHHWREATRWLVNACSKHGVDEASWRSLVTACAEYGYPIALKARLRRHFRALL